MFDDADDDTAVLRSHLQVRRHKLRNTSPPQRKSVRWARQHRCVAVLGGALCGGRHRLGGQVRSAMLSMTEPSRA